MNATPTPPGRRSPWFFPVLFAPVFMVIVDIFIVNVTAPSLRTDLGASDSDLQWIVAAYLLTYALSLITGGRLGDILGRRRMFKTESPASPSRPSSARPRPARPR